MTETRKIIGVFDELVSTKKDVAFPSVRVWLNGPNGYETRGLKQFFPDRGTVFLHVSACDGQYPVRNQFGLFTCVPSPGEKAEWKVFGTSRHLAKVVYCPTWERNPQQVAFWEWLVAHKDGGSCNILLGDGTVFVRRGKSELVGPFQTTPEGSIVARKQIQCFGEVETVKIEIGGKSCEFIDIESLAKGRPLIVDPKDAIHRRLKLAHDTSHLDWLSRAKLQELSTALTGVAINDGSEWVMECLPRALENISSSGNLNEKLRAEILQIKAVETALEEGWKKKYAEAVKKADEELEKLKGMAAGIRKANEDLNDEASRLQQQKKSLESELLELNKNIEVAKSDAQKVFDNELKRLAVSPASLALFGAWSSFGNKTNGSSPQLQIKIQRRDSEQQKAASLFDAFVNNFKACGLSSNSATEVAIVCGAALLSGQPLSFRSIFSDSLADAMVGSLGQPATLWADVPAGLLSSLDWDSLIPADHINRPLILSGANRSDTALVLGSKRSSILRQSLGYQKPDGILILTLEPNKAMQVEPDFKLGPLIDDQMLRFTTVKSAPIFQAYNDYASNLAELTLILEDDFIEVIGDDLAHLPVFSTSAQRLLHRRAIAGLKLSKNNNDDVARFFFKYWILPRLTTDDATAVFEVHKEKWKSDLALSELSHVLMGNE